MNMKGYLGIRPLNSKWKTRASKGVFEVERNAFKAYTTLEDSRIRESRRWKRFRPTKLKKERIKYAVNYYDIIEKYPICVETTLNEIFLAKKIRENSLQQWIDKHSKNKLGSAPRFSIL